MKNVLAAILILQFLPAVWLVSWLCPCDGWRLFPGVVTIGAVSLASLWCAVRACLFLGIVRDVMSDRRKLARYQAIRGRK